MRNVCLNIIFACLLTLLSACQQPKDVVDSDMIPPIYPDYTDITIPQNIAPLNFIIRNNPSAVEMTIEGESTRILKRDNYEVSFPRNMWRSILETEVGNTITVRITAKVDGVWIRYAPFYWKVVADKIDPFLSYRLIEPGYEVWNSIQLRERNIETFDEYVIADNNLTDRSCMNCHIYGNQDPNLSFFHLRGINGGTILNRNGQLRKLNIRTSEMVSSATYGNFHTSGRYAIFSSNTVIPAFHTAKGERLEVYDEASDLVLADFDDNKILYFPKDTGDTKPFRTFPVFSSDGRYVYYCEAPFVELPEDIRELKYSIHRIPFDEASFSFGNQVDTIFSAEDAGKSASLLSASPDGRFLMYSVADYGTFPIWHRETDLQMINLRTFEIDSLSSINADYSDTYHSWSSNSRWFVFASKRDDGVYGKPYFSYIGSDGQATKPFLLPQKDPAIYDNGLKSYNIPQFSKGKLPFGARDIEILYREAELESIK
jgi:Periplasmic component of the Tol biopolymer transport system